MRVNRRTMHNALYTHNTKGHLLTTKSNSFAAWLKNILRLDEMPNPKLRWKKVEKEDASTTVQLLIEQIQLNYGDRITVTVHLTLPSLNCVITVTVHLILRSPGAF
jgi:hypothetical protein